MAKKSQSPKSPHLLTLPGCDGCGQVKNALKKKKAKVKFVSVGTKKGQKLAQKVNPDRYPFCVDIQNKGKKKIVKKCNVNKFLKKFNIDLK